MSLIPRILPLAEIIFLKPPPRDSGGSENVDASQAQPIGQLFDLSFIPPLIVFGFLAIVLVFLYLELRRPPLSSRTSFNFCFLPPPSPVLSIWFRVDCLLVIVGILVVGSAISYLTSMEHRWITFFTSNNVLCYVCCIAFHSKYEVRYPPKSISFVECTCFSLSCVMHMCHTCWWGFGYVGMLPYALYVWSPSFLNPTCAFVSYFVCNTALDQFYYQDTLRPLVNGWSIMHI